MRLKDFFCCCLPAPGDNSNYDEKGSPGSTKEDTSYKKKSGKGLWKRMTTPSKKKLRKEAKKLRHEMADRKRKEVHVMDIILEAEDEPMMISHPLVLRKETPEENVEDERIGNVVFHKTLVHATQHSQDVAGPVVGIPQGETAQAKAEFPLSIDVLEMVYTNLSSGIDMGLLCHLVQLSKDLRKGDSCGGDQPFQNDEPPSPSLVPTDGELSHLTMHEEKEEKPFHPITYTSIQSAAPVPFYFSSSSHSLCLYPIIRTITYVCLPRSLPAFILPLISPPSMSPPPKV
ncbi:uncharacterized protein LOC134468806 [Engraulis encrasicolus]|uniref:uncharacterized protein LOC134468806 n=1 Tax=Engraulis encrasicolus TaxID=184585 RepID=UPI002FD4FDC9